MPALDPATREALAARLRFYRDLGLTEFYRRPVDAYRQTSLVARPSHNSRKSRPCTSLTQALGAPSLAVAETSSPLHHRRPLPFRPASPFNPSPTDLPPKSRPADRAAALQLIREEIGDCTRCALHKGRNKMVFGDGIANARLMFVGEGPGADEDAQGIPFVGRAGQLLNNMIAAMGLKREEVYIANVVKCRPPGNRTPEPEEANTCSPFLFRQIDVVRPEVIVALGATAATYLLGQRQPLAGLRGRVHAFRGSKLIVTYHPAYLLRDPRQKKEAWADLQIAMRELGLKAAAKTVS